MFCDHVATWHWLSDDGWAPYSDSICKKLEVAYNLGEKKVESSILMFNCVQVAIDSERFIDLEENYQRRNDDPTKRRPIKREKIVPTPKPKDESIAPKQKSYVSPAPVTPIFDALGFHFPVDMPRDVILSIEARGGHVFRKLNPSV